jgi:HKD family nuclease
MKARFATQPLSGRFFGSLLIDELRSGRWKELDVSVAWVRLFGVLSIKDALQEFLESGGQLYATVGVDGENTSVEGLQELLQLSRAGHVEVFIHHNEDRSLVYHPKLYVFRNEKETKVIVGSNNLTQAGLYRNTEAALELEASSDEQVFEEIRDAIARWRKGGGLLARPLDRAFLKKLEKHGYVKPEIALRHEPNPGTPGRPKSSGTALFGYVPVAAPPVKRPEVKLPTNVATKKRIVVPVAAASGQQLVIRVRLARGTQAQIPIRLKEGPFLKGIDELVSLKTGAKRGIHEARTSGATRPNTLKIELRDAASVSDPVLLLHKAGSTVTYVIFDRKKGIGRQHWEYLLDGLESGRTDTTFPSDPERATMWRFI